MPADEQSGGTAVGVSFQLFQQVNRMSSAPVSSLPRYFVAPRLAQKPEDLAQSCVRHFPCPSGEPGRNAMCRAFGVILISNSPPRKNQHDFRAMTHQSCVMLS